MSLDEILESPRLMMKLSFPPVMLQLMEEASKPEPDFAVLGKIISMDPALSTTILNLVNSPFYGLSQEITDFKRAAVVLGTRELLNLAVTVTYQKHICTNLKNDDYKVFNDWMLTVWGAISAQLIASRICPDQADKVYLCCLLKDISLFFLRCAAPRELPGNVSKKLVTNSYHGQSEDEGEIWGMNHGALSQLLLTRWKMNTVDCPSIQHHHELDEIDSFDAPTKALILATKWAEMELGENSGPFNVLQFEVQLQRSLDMDEDAIEQFREVCRTKFQSMLTILGISEGEADAHFYNHSIRSLQSSYFLSLELLTAEGGMDSIAKTIGRHLKLSWDLTSWELSLKSPHTDKYKLYRVVEGEGLKVVAVNVPEKKIPWQRRSKGEDILSKNFTFGNFRFDSQKMRDEDRNNLKLYFRFIGQAYEHYCAKQHLIEGRAETLESLPLGIASLDSQGDLIDMNEEMSKLLGGASVSGARNFSELFRLGLGSGIGASWTTFLEDDSKKSFSKIICASLRTGGMPRDACLYISAYKQKRGEDELVTLVMEDIREISESQIQALKQRDFLEGLVDSMRDVVLTVDKRGNINYASSRFSKIFLGRNIFDIATPSETFIGRWGPEMFERDKTIVEVLLKRTDTSGRPFEFVISKLAGPGEKSLIVARDLTAIRRLEDKLKRQAVFDGLTDLFNHTQFNSLMAREIKRSNRTGRPVGLLFFDLDGFKAVNDTEGHQVGDEVLKGVGEILRNELRSGMDFPCRYGGDEFGVIVTEVRPEALESIGNRIRLRVESKFSGKVTISGGLTVLKEGDTSASMLSRADKATYEAKDLGGNVLVWAK